MSEESHLTTETLLAMITLIVFIITGPLFEKWHFHYAHESGVVMLVGIVLTLIVNYFDPEANFAKTLHFDHDIFFTLILPPIIFSAGYNLRRKFFFKYIFYILLFGVVGTIISFCSVAPLTYLVNQTYGFGITYKKDIFDKNGMFKKGLDEHGFEIEKEIIQPHHRMLNLDNSTESLHSNVNPKEVVNVTLANIATSSSSEHSHSNNETINENIFFSTKEILLFASIISATDTVAALVFIKEDSDPKLFPILLGEGVVNDAVCIVLYQIIKSFLDSGKSKINK